MSTPCWGQPGESGSIGLPLRRALATAALATPALALATSGISLASGYGLWTTLLTLALGGLLATVDGSRRGKRALPAAGPRSSPPSPPALHLDWINDIALLANSEGRIVGVNDRALAAYGYTREEMLQLHLRDLRPLETRAAFQRQFNAAQSGAGLRFETVHCRRDGAVFPVEVSVRVFEVDGQTVHQSTVRDISLRKQAEASAAYQAMLLENVSEAVLGLDSKFLLRSWNQAAERVYGYSAEEVLGTPILELLRTEYRRGSNMAAAFCNVDREGRIRLDVRQYRKDGTPIEIEGVSVPLTDRDGRITGYVAVNREVTDRRRAEKALRASEERLKLALAGTNDGLWDYHPSTGQIYLSSAWANLLGYSSEELDIRMEPLATLLFPSDPAIRGLVAAHLDGKSERYEYELRLSPAGREPLWILVRGKVVERGPDGAAVRITGTMSDVTEKRKMQARLLQTDRMASMGSLAAVVAHEINNPLAYVVSNLSFSLDELGNLLAAGAGQTQAQPQAEQRTVPKAVLDEAYRALQEAKDGAERVRRIVRDLKTFSRIDDQERGPVDVVKILESSINLARYEIRHRATLVTDLREVPLVDGSEHRLGQVFLNLLINAAQAIPEGHPEENEIRAVARQQEDGRVAIEISDTGSGIAPDAIGRIFDPFFTTKPAGVGTGLGLSICHGIVGALHGELLVESELGKGSTFRVILPPSPQSPAEPEPPAHPPEDVPRGRILVIDDEPLVGSAVQRLLAARHDVVIETAARQALGRLERGERFDMVFCDLMMPEMSGMDLYEAMERVDPELARRTVFITGGAFTARAREFLERTASPHLDKPFDNQALLDLVLNQLGGHPGEA
jgi:PAS domain S-box-containing protein